MFGLPEKQLSFLLHAGCDTLPTPMNLARWKMITNPICALCQSTQPTTDHVLTGCSVAVDQGRYTWHHDSVLQVFVCSLLKDLSPSSKLYVDLPGHLASESPPSTIPSNLSTFLSRPDFSPDSITLLELSVVTNTKHHFLAASHRKQDRYVPLLQDLKYTSLSIELVTLKVGCLGHFMPATVANCQEYPINQNILFVASFSKQQKLLYLVCIGSSMPDPQHHETLLICWTNYCAVLCLGVVVMCVFFLFFVVFMPCQGPCYFNLVPLSLGPHFLLYVVILS